MHVAPIATILLAIIAYNTSHATDSISTIPENNLSYPIFLHLKSGSFGSGFFVNTEKEVYLVTAAHVLYDKKTDRLKAKSATASAPSRIPSEQQLNKFRLDLQELEKTGRLKKHPTHDIALIQFAFISSDAEIRAATLIPGVTTVSKGSGVIGVNQENTRRLSEVKIGNDVYVFGYPNTIGISTHPQIDPKKPLVRHGIIAGKNDALGTMILDCELYGGNSGGPVVEKEQEGFSYKYRVVGVATEYIPFDQSTDVDNSGYSVAVSIEYVLNMIPFGN